MNERTASAWLAAVSLAACGRVSFDPVGDGAGDEGAGRGDGGSDSNGNNGGSDGGVACGTLATCTGVMYTLNPTSGGSAGGQQAPYANARQGSCGGAGGGDLVVHFEAPQGGTFRFTLTASFDSVLYIRDGSCTGPELACDDVQGADGETLTVTLAGGQNVFGIVDANGGCGDYDLAFQGL